MAGEGDEFSLVPQWLKTSHGLQSPGAGSHSAGHQRDAWNSRGSPHIISSARPAADSSLRPLSSSVTSSSTANGASSATSLLPLTRADRGDRDRDRGGGGHAAWNHFHTSSRTSRAGPHTGRESASGTSSFADTDRFHPLGSPFKNTPGSGFGSTRHGLQRSVSDSGGAVGSADAGPSLGGVHHRDRLQLGPHRQGQLGGGQQYGYSADDKLGWRDSNRQQQQQQHGPAAGRAGNNKPPPLTSNDFPSLAAATSMGGSSPRSSSSDRLGSPQPYAPSVAPYKQDFLVARGSLGWTSKLADVPGATAAAAAAVTASPAATGTGTPAAAHEQGDVALLDGGKGGAGENGGSSSGGSDAGPAREGGRAEEKREQALPGVQVPAPAPAGVKATATAAALATGPSSLGSTPAGGTSLADTLKQAVAAGNAAGGGGRVAAAAARIEAQRRQSKALVPLIPGSKAKHTAGNGNSNGKGSIESRAAASRRLAPGLGGAAVAGAAAAAAAAAASAAGGSNGSSAASMALLSPASPVPLLKLGTLPQGSSAAAGTNGTRDSESTPSAAAAAGAAGTASAGLLSPVSPVPTGTAQAGTGTGSVNGDSTGVQRGTGVAALMPSHSSSQPHLSDRHSFFAVLKRKSSAHQHSSASGPSAAAAVGATGVNREDEHDSAIGGGATAAAANSAGSSLAAEQAGIAAGGAASSGESPVVAEGGSSSSTPQEAGSSSDLDSSTRIGTDKAVSVPSTPQDNSTVDTAAAGVALQQQDHGQQEEQQEQQQRQKGPSSYSLSDIPDTLSSCGGSEGGRSSSSGGSATHSQTAEAHQAADKVALAEHVQQGSGDTAAAAVCVGAGTAGGEGVFTTDSKGDRDKAEGGAWDVLEEEEEAFLRSLGWTSSDEGDDEGSWGLTQEEIAAFQAAAAAAARRTQQQQQRQVLQQEQLPEAAAEKLAEAARGGMTGICNGFNSSSSAAGVGGGNSLRFNGRTAGFKAGERGLWLQHLSPNGCALQGGHLRGMQPFWPPGVIATRFFGGDSSSEEESDIEGAD